MSDPPRRALTLDLGGTVCGFAHGALTDRLPTFGSWHLPRVGGRGSKFVSLENVLATSMTDWGITDVVVEAPLPLPALFGSKGDFHANAQRVREQNVLSGIAEMEAYRARAKYSEVSADLVRGAVLGRRRFEAGTVKAAVIEHCRRMGLAVTNDHEGDACLIWAWIVAQLTGRILAGPLFRDTA